VLEFGCGSGRHLRYLRQVPGLEVHGYDQSSTMLAGIAKWAESDWIGEHIRGGEPVGTLPYEDRSFDIVFSAEVLVHVAPQDLPTILGELMRVARWQVLHWETAPGVQLACETHGGCWNHDLVSEYARLGRRCEVLPQGYNVHVPYRVVLDQRRPVYCGGEVVPALLRRMETDLQHELDAADALCDLLCRQADLDCDSAASMPREPNLLARAAACSELLIAQLGEEQDRADRAAVQIAALRTELAEEQDEACLARQQLQGRPWWRRYLSTLFSAPRVNNGRH
jgi:SAM-dependent methyltransferase